MVLLNVPCRLFVGKRHALDLFRLTETRCGVRSHTPAHLLALDARAWCTA